MHIRCPHCHSPVELGADDSLHGIACPSCGSTFSLISGETTSPHHAGEPDTNTQVALLEKTATLGHFELIERVGMGQFGTVWKARDTTLQRTVALKIPRRGELTESEIEFFFRDARAAAQLDHAGIVNVHEVGRDGETIYVASQFIDGANLSDWLRVHRLTSREAAEMTVKIALAVEHAHQRGVVHRDLKPGNILIDQQGEPHVADFGLAKRETGEITMTMDGQILGTPAYMSPEQAKGKAHEADARSDVYSLGVILFELLTGELPFRGDKRMLVVQIINEEPPRPAKLNSRIPRDLETICLKALAKDSGQRYQSAEQMAADLRRWIDGEPIHARPIGRVRRGWRWCKRKPVAAGFLSALVLLVAVLTVASGLIAAAYRREAGLAAANLNLAKKEGSARRKAELLAARQTFELGWTEYKEGNMSHALLHMAHCLVALENLSSSTENVPSTFHPTLADQLIAQHRLILHETRPRYRHPRAGRKFAPRSRPIRERARRSSGRHRRRVRNGDTDRRNLPIVG